MGRVIWKTYPDDEDYMVSNTGQVKHKIKGLRKIRTRPDGYISVAIRRVSFLLHRVVGKTFLKNPNNLPQINHKDGIKSNNNADNLEWCDQFHNQQHRFKVLGHKGPKNENYPTGKDNHLSVPIKLTNLLTGEVLTFHSVIEGTRYFNLKSPSSISNVLRGRAASCCGHIVEYLIKR